MTEPLSVNAGTRSPTDPSGAYAIRSDAVLPASPILGEQPGQGIGANGQTEANGQARAPRPESHALTRLLALAALWTLSAGVFYLVVGCYFALTDAWIAPLQLSPNSREVVMLRVQEVKERNERAQLEG